MNGFYKMVAVAILLVGGFAAGVALIASTSTGAYGGRLAAADPAVETGCPTQVRLAPGRFRSGRCRRPDPDWINCASGGDCDAITRRPATSAAD